MIVPDADEVGAAVGQPLELTVRPEKILLTTDAPGARAMRDPRHCQRGGLPRHVDAVRGADRRGQPSCSCSCRTRPTPRTSPSAASRSGCRGARNTRSSSRQAPTPHQQRRRASREPSRRTCLPDLIRGLTQPRLSRRRVLQVGGLSALGLGLTACGIPGAQSSKLGLTAARAEIAKFWATHKKNGHARLRQLAAVHRRGPEKQERSSEHRPVHPADRDQGRLHARTSRPTTRSSPRSSRSLPRNRALATTSSSSPTASISTS